MRRKILLLGSIPLVSFPLYLYDKDATLYSWGSNRFGQLGLGHYTQIRMPQDLDLNPESFTAKGPISACILDG